MTKHCDKLHVQRIIFQNLNLNFEFRNGEILHRYEIRVLEPMKYHAGSKTPLLEPETCEIYHKYASGPVVHILV